MTERWIYVTGWAVPRAYYQTDNGDVVDAQNPREMAKIINRFMEESSEPTVIVGHSLGAFVLAQACQWLTVTPKRIVGVGVRPGYPNHELRAMRRAVAQDSRAVVSQFMALADPGQRVYPMLAADIDREWPADRLIWGLDQLERFDLPPLDSPCGKLWRFVHGTDDQIAPASEIQSLAEDRQFPLYWVPNGAHILSIAELKHAAQGG